MWSRRTKRVSMAKGRVPRKGNHATDATATITMPRNVSTYNPKKSHPKANTEKVP